MGESEGGVDMAWRSWLPVLLAAGLVTAYGPAPAAQMALATNTRSPSASRSEQRTSIQIDLSASNGTASDNTLRMRQYWKAELGLTEGFNRKTLIWRLATSNVLPGHLKLGHPRTVKVESGGGWGPGVVIWYRPVTLVMRSGSKQHWLLVTVQERPGQSEQMADLLQQARAATLQHEVSATSATAAAQIVRRYFQAIERGRIASARALMAGQGGKSPDTGLKTAKNVQFHGGTVARVGRALFYDLAFSADVRYPQGTPRTSGRNTYFFVVSNLNGPWQILSEGSGP